MKHQQPEPVRSFIPSPVLDSFYNCASPTLDCEDQHLPTPKTPQPNHGSNKKKLSQLPATSKSGSFHYRQSFPLDAYGNEPTPPGKANKVSPQPLLSSGGLANSNDDWVNCMYPPDRPILILPHEPMAELVPLNYYLGFPPDPIPPQQKSSPHRLPQPPHYQHFQQKSPHHHFSQRGPPNHHPRIYGLANSLPPPPPSLKRRNSSKNSVFGMSPGTPVFDRNFRPRFDRSNPSPPYKNSTRGSSSGASSYLPHSSENFKTTLCSIFAKTGHCNYGMDCRFAHGHRELRSVNMVNNMKPRLSTDTANTANNDKYKTAYCKSFRDVGICKYGENCLFAHGPEELRSFPNRQH